MTMRPTPVPARRRPAAAITDLLYVFALFAAVVLIAQFAVEPGDQIWKCVVGGVLLGAFGARAVRR